MGKAALMNAQKMNDMSEAERQRNYNSMMLQKENEMRKQNRMSYKDELDNQMKQRKAFQMYGNMSKQEKSMNKNDLIAYKNYDNNQYALIPGFSS